MVEKVIALEESEGPFQVTFQRVMRKVPQRERSDKKLQRLIAFRLKQDGEATTSEYLIAKMKEVLDCAYTGRLYDFLKDDLKEKECFPHDREPDPPEVA
jgi:hypothetical protein